jgi:hypothetical protein
MISAYEGGAWKSYAEASYAGVLVWFGGSMFDEDRLRETLQLQHKSYELLRWANRAVKEGRLKVAELHGKMSTFEAARSWIERNLSSLPPEARPAPDQVDEFAHLFASYLITSFQVAKQRWVSDGCDCSFCSYLIAVPHLRVKTPSRLDRELARKLKVLALERLALDFELPLFADELERFLAEHPEIERDLALVAWTIEVLRRGEFRGQGEPVLALWREVAWKDGRPDRKFEPTPERVLTAQARVGDLLKNTYAGR